MAEVFEHSSYDADSWPRFARTAQYVTTVNFGTTSQVHAAAARVRGMHHPFVAPTPSPGDDIRLAARM